MAGEASPAKAGPSTTRDKGQRKRRSSSKSSDTPSTQPPSKLTRIDDEGDADVEGGAGIDPMEALDNGASNGGDPMEGLERDITEVEVPGAVPVRADEFEQEAERVVEAAKGLDGGDGDEGQVKLVHQVRHQVRLSFRLLVNDLITRWLYPLDSLMYQYHNINASTLLRERTNSNWILSSMSRHLVLNETKVC
jgi:hypothetical protein